MKTKIKYEILDNFKNNLKEKIRNFILEIYFFLIQSQLKFGHCTIVI